MGDNTEWHQKVLSFLAEEFARKEGRQCIAIELLYSPGNGFKDEEIRKWSRTEEPDLFDSYVHIEKLTSIIIEIAEGEADSKPAGKHRFVVRTHQALGGRARQVIWFSPSYSGGSDEALVSGGGGGGVRQDVIANHAAQLMRINAGMYESTIRVLAAQNSNVMSQNTELHAENIKLRREIDEARSVKDAREFEFAMAAEKNARHNAGFQKLLQFGTVAIAKMASGGDEAQAAVSPLGILITDFYKSLRQDQLNLVMGALDMGQKILFMQIVNTIQPPQQPGQQGGTPGPGGPGQPPRGINGA